MRLTACLALASIASLALGTAFVAVAIRRARSYREHLEARRARAAEPARCPVCGELVREHYAQTSWQLGGIDA